MAVYGKVGDIFATDAKVIVNPVNIVGVMGKGLALEFKNRYPLMFAQYVDDCREGILDIGKLTIYKGYEKWIVNFPTKRHFRENSTLEIIERGLNDFTVKYKMWGIESVAFPKLGSGLGGLNWLEVKPLMVRYLLKVFGEVYIYE